MAPVQIGKGVRIAGVQRLHSQGAPEQTSASARPRDRG